MNRTAAALAFLVAAPAAATADLPRLGIFRKKKDETPAPANKARQLLDTLKSDPDEKKRKDAAADLADLDPRSNADIIPGLVSTIQKDPSAAVRAEAAETIGKLKPVSQEAGVALQQTAAGDPAEAVRKAAEKALWQYHLNGYRAAETGIAPQSAEPPLAKPTPPKPVAAKPQPPIPSPLAGAVAAKPAPVPPSIPTPVPPPRPVTQGIGRAAVYPQTIEPPLAKPAAKVEEKPVPKLETPPAAVPGVSVPKVETPPAVPLPAIPSVPPPASVPSIPPPGKG